MTSPSRLVLGTAQLAGPYGLLSQDVEPSSRLRSEARDILEAASAVGIRCVDTSPRYGKAEELIGLSSWAGEVWSKLDARLPPEESVAGSLAALDRSRLDVLFVHDVPGFLAMSEGDVRTIQSLRGPLVDRLGISAYEPEEVSDAMRRMNFDVVQLPVNVFDTNLELALSDGRLSKDVTYVGRSVFLQGILAQPHRALARVTPMLEEWIIKWQRLCHDLVVAPGEAALAWALSRPYLDAVIVGAESSAQLLQVVDWSNRRNDGFLDHIKPVNLWPLSDPRRWSR